MASNASLAIHPRDIGAMPVRSGAAKGASPTSLTRRLFRAMMAARQRQADRAIARYLAATGMKFTDSVEREIERRLLNG